MTEIPGYTLHTEVFLGFRSILYRGIRERDNRPVLIRIYETIHAAHGRIARFKKEFSMMEVVKSTGLIRSYGIVHYRNCIALVLEDFKGIPLKKCISRGSLPITQFLDIAVQLAVTLAEIHHADITHGGLRPENIWVNQDTGEVMIIDYGLSSIITRENEHIYDPYVLREILPYFSPEQTGRMNRIMDSRTDFYSLGVIFYEILTNTLPFYPNNPLELFHKHIAKMPIPVTELNHEIPEPICSIIMKILSKDPEDRYQSSYGLKTDLEECIKQLRSTGKIESFSLGTHDISCKLIIPQKIYGRKKEIDILTAAFDSVSHGRSSLMLLNGPAGIGKTLLINEVQKPIVRRKGYFISGKCDMLTKDMPYSAFIKAFQGLIRQILSENEERIIQWKRLLEETLGNNGRIITDIIPQLELLIGKQPEVEELGLEESQNRFHIVFQDFVGIFAGEEHPLTIFLDDLQWVDIASLNLIKNIMSDPAVKHILFIGAFRENEVSGSHPLISWMDHIGKADVVLNQISLQPLEMADINELICDTLKCQPDASSPLAELICRKTGGNPFFIKQFLKVLYNEKLLTFSPEYGWQWNTDAINLMQVEDDVTHLLVAKILNLSESARHVLQYASSIGNRFDMELLSEAYGKPMDDTFSDLMESLKEGLVLLTGSGCQFTHDRIQEAAYSLLREDIKKQFHYKIGKRLLQKGRDEGHFENIFPIVDQLNLCTGLIGSYNERLELSRLNLSAGQKAKASVAYEAANRYLEMGIELLPSDAWEREYDLTLLLYTEMGEVKYLSGDHENVEVFINKVVKNAKRLMDKIRVYELKITVYTVLNKRKEALELGIKTLRMLGLDMPDKADPQIITDQMNLIKKNIGGREPKDLINLPELTDPDKLAAARILMSCTAAAYTSAPEYLPIIIMKLVNLSLKHGNSVYSSFAYISYGVILCSRLGEIELGYQFGRLALEIVDKLDATELKAKVYYAYGDMINHWKNHYREDLNYLLEAFKSGPETGDLSYASYALNHIMMTSFLAGENLHLLKEKMDEYYETMKKYGQLSALQEYELWYQMVINLNGVAEDKLLIKGDISDEGEMVPEWERANMFTAIGYYTVAKQLIFYLYGAFEKSIEAARAGIRCIETMTGMNLVAEYHYYFSLSLLAHYPNVSKEEQMKYLSEVEVNQEKIKTWASHAPENFEHKYVLIEAEKSRIRGEMRPAIQLYDRAVELAGQNGFIQDKAIANERAADFFISEGMKKIAAVYMQEAHKGYKQWGAHIKVSDLEAKFQHLFPEMPVEAPFTSVDVQSSQTQMSAPSMVLNYASIVESLQAISSEIILEKLLEKLMKIVVESANATRGLFISVEGNNLFVEAERTEGDDGNTVVKSMPIVEKNDLLLAAVNYVKRTKDKIVLDDAGKEGDFTSDPYVVKNQIMSILCLPVITQSRLIGILYMENSLSTGAFTPDRIEVLQLLASQAAISLENARLVDNMQRAEESLRESELRYRSLFEIAPTGIGISAQDGRIIACNDTMLRIIGYPREELGHINLKNIYQNPDDRALLMNRLQSDGSVRNFETELKNKQGTPSSVSLSLMPFTWSGEGVIMTVADDITERKQAEALLEESEEKYRLLAETAKDYIMINSLDGPITYANKATMETFGYSNEELLKMKIIDLIAPDCIPEYYEHRERRKKGDKQVFVYETEVIAKTGQHIPVEASSSVLSRPGESPQILTISRNISERKRTEEELLRYRYHLEELVKERTSQLEAAQEELLRSERLATLGKLTATVSHEIRNPLGTIRSSLFLINQRTRNKDVGIEQALKRAERSVIRCDRIIDDLMDYTRIRDLDPEETVLDEWLDEILDEQNMPEEIILKRKLASHSEIFLDQERFRRCIVNVIDNACQAILEKKEKEAAKSERFKDRLLTIESRTLGERLEVRITDTGVGIPSDKLEKVFEPLYSTRGFGIGLGLTTVKQIMEQHGGGAEVESEPGKETTVTLWLPVDS